MDVDDHRHCKVCGKVCAANAETCSRACEETHESRIRTKRMWTNILYITAVVLLFLLLIELLR